MVDLKNRIGIISTLVQEKPGLGKTALMKYVFLLQKVYKVPLGYDFEIYTYGPYSSEVMEEIDHARRERVINIERIFYPTGHSGYQINPTNLTEEVVNNTKDFVLEYEKAIEEVLEYFGDKTAKELELSTTIIYLYALYNSNNWTLNVEDISKNVQDIKPHFKIETIKSEYQRLEQLGILQKAI